MKKALVAMLAIIGLGMGLRCSGCEHDRLRIATYNVRTFGKETDLDRLTTILAKTDADVIALQEIMNEARLREVARRLSQGSRRFTIALSRCGGKSKMHVGFLYDAAKVALLGTKEYQELDPEDRGTCSAGERPGFAGTFEEIASKRKLTLLVVHFLYGGERERFELRKAQWKKAHRIAAEIGKTSPVAILGDANSTGWDENDFGERTFIRDEAERGKLVVATNDLGCSNYWQPGAKKDEDDTTSSLSERSEGAWVPSTLDHVVLSPALYKRGSTKVHSFCQELSCKKTSEKPADYAKVTDHCPVTFDLPAP